MERMRKISISGVAFFTAFLLLPSAGGAQLVLYDDFSLKTINPDKWHGGEGSAGASGPDTESSRGIKGGKLQLQLTSYGGTSSDAGTPLFNGQQRLRINSPGPVTIMQASVAVKSALAEHCEANTTPTRVRAGIRGSFFNDGSSSGVGDATGDIRAPFEKRRTSTTGGGFTDTIRAFILRCSDADCDTSTTLASHTFIKVWAKNKPDTLKLEWDAANDRFLFTVNPGTAGEESKALSYTVTDTDPPGFAYRQLEVRIGAANCTPERRAGSITALFNDVMINP